MGSGVPPAHGRVRREKKMPWRVRRALNHYHRLLRKDAGRSRSTHVVSISRWTEEELVHALEYHDVVDGPLRRELPDGRVQHYAFVRGWNPGW